MKVVVFGSTGKIGREVVIQALAQGHEVTAFLRDPAKLTFENEPISGNDRLRSVTGDVFEIAAVKQAVQGQDAVICSIGSMSLGKTTVRGEGTANIVKAMEEAHVDRLFVVSAMGVGNSDLKWTILRPSGLTDGPMTGSYDIGKNIQAESSQISAADVAHAIVKELDENAFVRMAVTITN